MQEENFIPATEIKELKSETKASAVHVKWSKKHYHVVKAFHGGIGWIVSGYGASNRGKPIHSNRIFAFISQDLEKGVEHLLNVLNGLEEPKIQEIFYR